MIFGQRGSLFMRGLLVGLSFVILSTGLPGCSAFLDRAGTRRPTNAAVTLLSRGSLEGLLVPTG